MAFLQTGVRIIQDTHPKGVKYSGHTPLHHNPYLDVLSLVFIGMCPDYS